MDCPVWGTVGVVCDMKGGPHMGGDAVLPAVKQRAGKRVKLTRGAQVHADSGE
jgi:hypothetical protein